MPDFKLTLARFAPDLDVTLSSFALSVSNNTCPLSSSEFLLSWHSVEIFAVLNSHMVASLD